jgi:hypothetical protein
MSRPRLSRDEVIDKGLIARERGELSHDPWIYYAKVKSGTRATRNVTGQYYSIPHLIGEMVMKHARENETLNVYAITRVMRSHLRLSREDI